MSYGKWLKFINLYIMKKNLLSIAILVLLLSAKLSIAQNKIVVFQSDFGLKDGAVSAMKGVAMGVSTDLKLFDLTHEIPAYNIWEASYRLEQTVRYWPIGTVFVSVVDPGVGTARKSVVLKTKSGHYIVTPDNGTLTLISESLGIDQVREIDENINRRKDSKKSYTFHGRDVYAFTAARLAAGVISYEQVGPLLPNKVVTIPYQQAVLNGKTIKGNIPVLDVQYGNVWTNIPDTLFNQLNPHFGDVINVTIFYKQKPVYQGTMPYSQTFGEVAEGKPLAYINSLLQLSFALNQGDFAKTYKVASGNDWSVEISLR
jgi:S-adenosylmethionine hydrolase